MEKKYFEKLTISQFKKSSHNLRWNLGNKEQLYLLSRFPSFRGIGGSIIPMEEFDLLNYSKCLGSFNLLFHPGDFAFISAGLLENLLRDRKSISMIDLSKLWELPTYYFAFPLSFDRNYVELFHDLLYILLEVYRRGMSIPFFSPFFSDVLGFSYYASNIHDFVDKYLRAYVGELVYSNIGAYNKPALIFFHKLLSAIRQKAQMEDRREVMVFVDEFFQYPYSGDESDIREGVEFDYKGGGIGIIYTSINLGE